MSQIPSIGVDAEPANAHTGPIRHPRHFLLAVVLGFGLPILVIIGLVKFVTAGPNPVPGVGEADALKSLEARIRPVGTVEIRDPNRPPLTGEELYRSHCINCHKVLGGVEVWKPRIARGFDTLLRSAINGKGAMPPRAGGDFRDVEIARAIVFMANAAGARFVVPPRLENPVPAQAGAPAATPTSAQASGQPVADRLGHGVHVARRKGAARKPDMAAVRRSP